MVMSSEKKEERTVLLRKRVLSVDPVRAGLNALVQRWLSLAMALRSSAPPSHLTLCVFLQRKSLFSVRKIDRR
jgi:hypothetical protein